jgi:CelD/BcsL family acetyltransferase involved in cellulose biosynthesis
MRHVDLRGSIGERVEWITDEERFAAVRQAWEDVADTTPRPFSAHDWFSHWWDAFGAGRRLRVCVLWRGEELAAAFPLCERDGSLEALANVHTPVFEPLARSREDLRRVSEVVATATARALRVPCLPVGEAVTDELQRASRQGHRWLLVSPMHTSPIVRTTGPLDAYLGAPGRTGPLPRYRRKMAREYDARFEILAEPDDLESVLRDGLRLEAAGWKGRAGTAIISDPRTHRFYRGVAHAFRARGELRVSCIRLGGKLVAFDLCVLRHGRLWLLKTAYDEHHRHLAPGLVMRLSIIERCFELGLEAHELAGDTADWKRRFADDERSHVLLTSFARCPGTAVHVAWRGHARPLLGRARRALRARRGGPAQRA